MTAIPVKRNLFDAVLVEPVELAISQPHQAFISAASIALVAVEAGHIVPWPWNITMAVGAEWAYLKGLSTRERVDSPWNGRLIWAAVLLVIVYGSLAGARKLGVPLPDDGWKAQTAWEITGAVALTLVHILCIGAVTVCSAMVHRAALDAEHAEQKAAADAERDRQVKLQAERDALELERQKKEQDLALWVKAQEAKKALRPVAAAKPATERPPCPACGAILNGTDYALFKSAQARGAKFNGCKTCRAA